VPWNRTLVFSRTADIRERVVRSRVTRSNVEDLMGIKGISGNFTALYPMKKGCGHADRRSEPQGSLNSQNTCEFRIRYDDQLGRIIVRIVDKESQEVVNQIPSEEVVAFLSKFRSMTGVLVDRVV